VSGESSRAGRGEERYFERRQIKEAIAWAEGGGIAVHRNLDRYDGQVSEGGRVMRRPFLHVIGMRPVLEDWALREGVPLLAIQPERKRRVAHIDVYGPYAQALVGRLAGRG
jgi:hypothetical protein